MTMRPEYCRRCMAAVQAVVILGVLALMLVHLRFVLEGRVGDVGVNACNAVLSMLVGVQSVVVWYRWREIRCR